MQDEKMKKSIIYRPAKGIGIGHLIYAASQYYLIAQSTSRDFYFTVAGTIFSLGGSDDDFLNEFFEPLEDSASTHVGISDLKSNLGEMKMHGAKAAVFGRDDQKTRAAQEFSELCDAIFVDSGKTSNLTASTVSEFDLFYVDSVFSKRDSLSEFGKLMPFLRFRGRYIDQLKIDANADKYIAVHCRHGNGEDLNARMSGSQDDFSSYLNMLCEEARRQMKIRNISDALVFSDNAETAEKLARLIGGRTLATDGLPDSRFQDYFRANQDRASALIGKVMSDFALLSAADTIVSGASLFPEEAALVGNCDRHIIVSP